eukprot:COSAG05_NODE_1589_length_4476_cov_118.433630_7_plen_73_part_00
MGKAKGKGVTCSEGGLRPRSESANIAIPMCRAGRIIVTAFIVLVLCPKSRVLARRAVLATNHNLHFTYKCNL